MNATIPQPPRPGPRNPHDVKVTLEGHPADLIQTIIFLDRVTAGDNPADILRRLRLAGISIVAESGHAHRATLTLRLTEATS